MLRRSRFQSEQTFFGLKVEDKEQVILEPMFLLMYYGGFTWKEAFHLPVVYKRWFIERITKEIKGPGDGSDPDANTGRSRAYHHNTPEAAQLSGRRPNSPSRLRRF
jgi:hypothetical protein